MNTGSQVKTSSQSWLLLRCKRVELHLTQAQIAKDANILLRSYQRFEAGERCIENASFRIAMAVCESLSIDPYDLFPEEEFT